VKKLVLFAGLLIALGACGGPPPDQDERVHLRHGKVGSDPGVSIHGDIRVGVVSNL